MAAKKGSSGTRKMAKGRPMVQKESLYVQSAASSSQQQLEMSAQCTAQVDAEKELLHEYLGLSMVEAKPVAKNERVVPEVYDITVEDDHEFFANSILVHNCSDAFDYTLCLFLQKDWYKYKRGGNTVSAPTSARIAPTFEY